MNSIFIIGKISSGKSTVARTLSEEFNAPIISFSTYIKYLCKQQGLEEVRENLQDIGQGLVENSPLDFLEKTIEFQLEEKADLVLVEGVRHRAILHALKEISTTSVGIFLDIPLETRAIWYSKREGADVTPEELSKIEDHKAESEISDLIGLCDLTFNENTITKDKISTISEMLSVQ